MPTFNSVAVQQYNGVFDLQQLFSDMEKFMKDQRERLGMEPDERFGRKHPLQHVFNSTSGGYVSPTGMKGFESCPANYVLAKFFDERKGSATSVGHTFHAIMQRFYDCEERNREKLEAICDDQIHLDDNDDSKDYIMQHVNGYWEADDYLGGKQKHQDIQCANELFIKASCKPLGVDLGVPVYLLLDRLDVRDSGLYVIDYKTGVGNPNHWVVLSYLPQMIFYKWGVEEEYQERVTGALLSTPGAYDIDQRWVNMNVNSLVLQSKVVDDVLEHLEHAAKCKESRMYEIRRMKYCGSCPIKMQCLTYLRDMKMDESQAVKEIPIQIEVEDSKYVEE